VTRTAADAIPFARSVVALDPAHFAAIRRAVRLLFALAHGAPYAEHLERSEPVAPATARRRAGNTGVFMGYDFHLGAAGPRLIEINTNAGGALLNGLHTAALCDPRKLACLCSELLPVETMEERIVASFRAEVEAVRGPGSPLDALAIVDERPQQQFLYREFELFAGLFARHGIACRIGDTAELAPRADGGLELGGLPLDLVYLRDTDFLLEAPRSAALRDAYLAGSVVVTPAPREHFLLANKRRLTLFSSRERLEALGVAPEDAAFLAGIVPETRELAELGPDEAWRTRREWVFKPAAAFASRGVYRGDKISRRKLAEITAAGGYLAQRRIEPGHLRVETSEGPRELKFDVRAYAYRDEVLLLGARAYEGQVTNLRSPGGGFSAICVVRDASASRAG
jgi:hypothetical protein